MFGRKNTRRTNDPHTGPGPDDGPAAAPDPDEPPLPSRPSLLAERRPWPLVADEHDYERMFAATGSSTFSMIVNNFSLATLYLKTERHQVPSVVLHIPPDTFDFADPDVGFAGPLAPVPDHRVLRLWADDLLTISHGTDWTFIIDSAEAFDEAWLDTMFPIAGADFQPFTALVAVSFAPLHGELVTSLAEIDPTHPVTHARLEDHRTIPPSCSSRTPRS